LALIICFIYFYLIHIAAKCLIYTIVILGIIGLIGLGFFLYLKRDQIMEKSNFNEDLAQNYLIAAIVCWVFSGLILLLSCFLRKSINTAIKLVKAAG